MAEPATAPDRAHHAAASVLVAMVVLAPWPFGSAHWTTTAAIAIVGLAVSLTVGVVSLWHRRDLPLPRFAAALFALWALALLQVVPLPRTVLRLLAPGSAAVWYPANAAAAAVLGSGPRPISVYPEATLRWLVFSIGVLGLALVASPAFRSRAAVLRASVAVVASAGVVAVYALVARLAFGDRLFGFLAVPTIAPFGPFVSKNHFAGHVEMAACLALGLGFGLADEARHGPEWLSWLESRRAGWIVAAFGAAAVLVLAVPVSLSRGGVVSLGAGLATFAAVRLSTRSARHRTGSTAFVATGLLLLMALGVALALPEQARARVRTLGDVEQAGAYRLSTWRDSVRLFASSPLVGSGLGAYADALTRFKTQSGDLRVEHAENDYLETLADGGLVGSLLLALALVFGLAGAWRETGEEAHRLPRAVRAGALAAIAAVLVHSFVDFNLRIPANLLLAALVLAAAASPSRHAAGAATPPPRRASWRTGRAALLAPSAIAMVLALTCPWTERQLDTRRLQRGVVPAAALRDRSLEDVLVSHLGRRPADASGWLALAWLRVSRSQPGGADLAAWALQLDPLHPGIRQAARPVLAAAEGRQTP